MIVHGDCLETLAAVPSSSVDSLVTDPPAGISFMGKEWDDDKGGREGWIAWLTDVMRECHRVLKPGAHGLVWAIPRTSHWTMTALENAGFEIRDVVTHLFGTGFPKSLDVSKAIDKEAGAKRDASLPNPHFASGRMKGLKESGVGTELSSGLKAQPEFLSAPATDGAKKWQGFGTALKPACEFWVLIRKPCSEKTVAKNVLKWGTGALNIDGCRIEAGSEYAKAGFGPRYGASSMPQMGGHQSRPYVEDAIASGAPVKDSKPHECGRFPANLVLDEEAAEALDEQSGITKISGGSGPATARSTLSFGGEKCQGYGEMSRANAGGLGDVGGASRFFYVAKASKSDRGEDNKHPTVKSTKLMSYLCRLVTPPGGTVLDPFMGSGSTGVAAKAEGFQFVGIERDAEYFSVCERRIG